MIISKQLEGDTSVWQVLPLSLVFPPGLTEHPEFFSLLSWHLLLFFSQLLSAILSRAIFLLLGVETHFPRKIWVQPWILVWKVSTASKSKFCVYYYRKGNVGYLTLLHCQGTFQTFPVGDVRLRHRLRSSLSLSYSDQWNLLDFYPRQQLGLFPLICLLAFLRSTNL